MAESDKKDKNKKEETERKTSTATICFFASAFITLFLDGEFWRAESSSAGRGEECVSGEREDERGVREGCMGNICMCLQGWAHSVRMLSACVTQTHL